MIPVHAKRLPCSFPGDDWKLIENDGEFSLQWRAHCPALHGYLSRATAQSGSYTTQEGDRSNGQIVQIYFCACTIDETTALHNAQLSASFP